MPDDPAPNTLYYGDNLDVLRQHVADADESVLFAEQDGTRGSGGAGGGDGAD